jgi:hypothetical protein
MHGNRSNGKGASKDRRKEGSEKDAAIWIIVLSPQKPTSQSQKQRKAREGRSESQARSTRLCRTVCMTVETLDTLKQSKVLVLPGRRPPKFDKPSALVPLTQSTQIFLDLAPRPTAT